ncbi:MAG: TetR/AcrR family transcriptional regulator [Lachnospiraceae bacterium]|nr:TetR/AcrR family transcriptional regulator [Lachnospiraceae bacterium]
MDRRIQKTKKAIQSAYMTLLFEKNTTKITITEIAKKANIDRKTFYLHYESTNEIIREIAKEKLDALLIYLEEKNFFHTPYNTHIYFQCINQLLQQDISLFQHIVKHPDFHYFWEQIEDVMIQTFTDYLSTKVDLKKEELKIYAIFLASGINAVYTQWLKNELPVSLEELGKITSDISCYGTEKILSPNKINN